MLYFVHGTDADGARDKTRSIISSLLNKKPNASFFRMDDETFTPASLQEYIGGQGLFENRYIVFLDRVFVNEEAKEEVLKRLKEISESENIFILLEEKADKKTISRIEKRAEKTQEFSITGQDKLLGKKFDIFSLTDAFGKREPRKLWVLYNKARRADISPEEIHGILFWQLKCLRTVLSMEEPREAGLNPFVLRKSLQFSKNYTGDELRGMSRALSVLYHDARRGIVDFEIGLEKFLLSI